MSEPMKLLLVDDEPKFLASMDKRLKRRNFQVSTAQSGEETLECMERETFNAVVLDLKMPGIGGIELLRKIKHLYPLTEVIMLTGHASLDVAIEGMRLGALEYLLKPCDFEDLLGKLEMVRKKIELRKEKKGPRFGKLSQV